METWVYRIIGFFVVIVFSVMALGAIRYLVYLLVGRELLVDMLVRGLYRGLKRLYRYIRKN